MKAYYDKRPAVLESAGNGTWMLRTDITEETVQESPEMETRTQWVCEEVIVDGEPTYEKCVEALIRTRYSVSDEFAILRQRDTKPAEYSEYFAYAEECKAKAKTE